MMRKQYYYLVLCWCLYLPAGAAQSSLVDQYNVHQYIIDLEVSNLHTRICGNVTMKAMVTASMMDTVAMELIDSISSTTYMVVDSVWFNGNPVSYLHENYLVLIPLSEPVPAGQTFSVRIRYHGRGTGCAQSNYNGLFTLSYCGLSHTFSNSQFCWERFWWPCKQAFTDKADSVTLIITTDSLNRSVATGKLMATEHPGNGKARYRWETHYPISAYLISFFVGPLTEEIHWVPLPSGEDPVMMQSLLIPASTYYPMHLRAIGITNELMVLYSNLLGDYPFREEKYGYCITGLPVFTMENQTLCMMGYQSLDTTTSRYVDLFTFFFTARQLGFQWFGDGVTCSTWNDGWLVNGFSSYMEYVALQHIESQSSADAWMKDAHKTITSKPGGSVWVPDSVVNDLFRLFDYRLTYKKGPAILHILRYEINNDSLFFAVLKRYISTYLFGDASVPAFRQIAESVTGMDFSAFFDEWYYGNGFPIFDIRWEQTSDSLVITSVQTTSDSSTLLFRTPFDIRVYYPGGDTTVRFFQADNLTTCSIPFLDPVDSIAFDPEGWLIQQHAVHTFLAETISEPLFHIYPNPSGGKVVLEVNPYREGTRLVARILDLNGQVVKEQPVWRSITLLDLTLLHPGIYLVQLSGGTYSSTVKLILE